MTRLSLSSSLLLSLGLPLLAHATDGYFEHGYGVKAQGLGGVGIALPQDALAAATNPAGQAFLEDRLDGGLTWFQPKRGAEIIGNAGPINGSYDGNGKRGFLLPEFGWLHRISPTLVGGVSVYGNGGMDTSYEGGVPLFGRGSAGIDLAQVFVSPALSWQVTPTQSLGVAVNFAWQEFEARGLGNFANSFTSAAPANVTDQGTDTSTGWGLRLGWTGQIAPDWTLGATWASKVNTSKFSKYQGLFAESGGFDIPANYGLGLAWKAAPQWTVAADYERILYSDVASVGHPIDLLFAGNPLGSANGPGFGWKDVNVVKVGVSYAASSELTLRAGFNHSDQPIQASQTLFNILAPGVVQDHLTLGGSWKTSSQAEWSLAYVHGFRKTVQGSGSIPQNFGGGEANVHLEEDSLGLAFGWHL